jgi:hypothetical protein
MKKLRISNANTFLLSRSNVSENNPTEKEYLVLTGSPQRLELHQPERHSSLKLNIPPAVGLLRLYLPLLIVIVTLQFLTSKCRLFSFGNCLTLVDSVVVYSGN